VKILLTLTICLFLCLNLVGQEAITPDEIGIEDLYLAKDNGQGKAGEKSESFFTNDVPIYCIVQLNSTNPANVKMNFIALKVTGVKAESLVFTISYKTNGQQSRVNFTGQPEGGKWVPGTYRIDILVDEKPAKNLTFEIKKTNKEIEKEKVILPKPKTNGTKKYKRS